MKKKNNAGEKKLDRIEEGKRKTASSHKEKKHALSQDMRCHSPSSPCAMRPTTAPKYYHPRPTSPPTSAGATTPALALKFMPSPLEVEFERPLVCIRVLAIVTPLWAALNACVCCPCDASSRRGQRGRGGKTTRAPCTALLLLLLRSGCRARARARRARRDARRPGPILFWFELEFVRTPRRAISRGGNSGRRACAYASNDKLLALALLCADPRLFVAPPFRSPTCASRFDRTLECA